VDYTDFILPGSHEATIRIGWVPGRPGNVREKIGVKYGSCRTQIVLAGGCEAPKERKRATAVSAPSFPQKRAPLRSNNRTKSTNGVSEKKGDSVPPKVSDTPATKNPVQRAEGEPEFAPMRTSSDDAENVPPKLAMMTAKALKVPQVPDVSWSPQVVHQKKSVVESGNIFAMPPPHSGGNFANNCASHLDLRRETFIMDDPSFVSSTPSAAKMNHLLPADVSVIPNAGNEGKDKRRPSSKELFGPSITLTQHEEPSLRRETYVAQTLAPVNIQSPQLVKLTDVEVSNMLNFSDSPAGSSILINDSQRIVGEIDNVTKNVVKAEHQHEEVEVEDASLLVKNYMENSDKERSSAMVSTLTNSQKTNSTGEVTAIQTVVTSPSGEKTELVQKAISYQGKSSQDEQKYDKLFTPPSTHLVPSCTNSGDSYLDPPMVTNFGTGSTAHPDLRRDTFIKCDPSHVISTPSGAKMRDTPPIEPYTDTTDIHVHHQRPSSDELFGPAVHGEPILHQETYVAQTLTPVVEEEVDNASLLVKIT